MTGNPERMSDGTASDITARTLSGRAEWSAASLLYRSVFGYRDPEHAVSPHLLAALGENGGSTIGAFDGGELVGFCYGFSATDADEQYHYSQATVVAERAQGRGIGRLLKHAQASVARENGAQSMRWAFSPFLLRNAHFNLTVLGGRGIAFRPDFYDDGRSDRVIVRWDLLSPPAAGSPCGEVRVFADAEEAAPDPSERERLRNELRERLGRGEVLTDVTRLNAHDVVYRFQERA